MIIGITGSYGVLGSILTKTLYKYKIVRFTGDICETKDIIKWLTNNNLSAIIHLAAIVPIDKVNQNKQKAKKINFYGTKKLVDCIVEAEKPEGDPLNVGGKTKSLGLGITSLSASFKIPDPNLTDIKPFGSNSTVYLLGILLSFKI